MEGTAIVVTTGTKSEKVLARSWTIFTKQLQLYVPDICVQHHSLEKGYRTLCRPTTSYYKSVGVVVEL